MRRKSTTLTEQELEIMKIVWERDSVTVRDVYEALLDRRKVAYTTVMTMMKILEQKQYLKKNQADRAYVYRPAVDRIQATRNAVQQLVGRFFGDSPAALVLNLLEDETLEEPELEKIRELLQPEEGESK